MGWQRRGWWCWRRFGSRARTPPATMDSPFSGDESFGGRRGTAAIRLPEDSAPSAFLFRIVGHGPHNPAPAVCGGRDGTCGRQAEVTCWAISLPLTVASCRARAQDSSARGTSSAMLGLECAAVSSGTMKSSSRPMYSLRMDCR